MSSTIGVRKVAIIGALSAMGEALARMLANEGAHLALLGRSSDRLEDVAKDLRARGAGNVVTVAIDLATADQVAALKSCADALGGLDAVVLFYGLLGDQCLAERDLAEAHRIIDVNFTSAAAWMLAGADQLERGPSPGASLIAVSSVAGDRGRRSNYVYGAAKGGLSILMQGLAHRFAAKKDGPRAIVMKVGFVDTPMTAGIKKGGPLWAKPEGIAASIRKAMDKGGPVIYAPSFWRWIMLAIRVTPGFIFNKINL